MIHYNILQVQRYNNLSHIGRYAAKHGASTEALGATNWEKPLYVGILW